MLGLNDMSKKGYRKVQGVPQSQTAALPRHQEEEETDKTKKAQINLMGHFVPSPREREKRDRRDSRRDEERHR